MHLGTALRRGVMAAAGLLAVMFASAPTADAHTDFDYSLPTDGASVGVPIDEITVAFTLPVTLVGNGFEVLDPQNNVILPFAVTDDDTVFRLQFDPPLAGGTVAVKYEVRAQDGHVLTGNFVFVVDAPVPTTGAPPTTASPTTAPTTTTTAAPSSTVAETVLSTAPALSMTTATADSVEAGVAGDDESGSGDGVIIAISTALAVGAAGFVLVRSRTSGDT